MSARSVRLAIIRACGQATTRRRIRAMRAISLVSVVVALVLGSGGVLRAGAATQPGWFAGTWNTDFGGMSVTQSGAIVKGDYVVGTIEGTASGNVLTGTWKQGSTGGRIRFTLSSDGSTWAGVFGYNSDPPTKQWNGQNTRHAPRPKAGGSDLTSQTSTFAGTWNTDLGGLTLKQKGTVVTGSYGSGTVYGDVTGRTLRGTWKDKAQSGRIRFNISADGKKFTGAFGHGSQNPQEKWNGIRTS
jgi:hypothetical protein